MIGVRCGNRAPQIHSMVLLKLKESLGIPKRLRTFLPAGPVPATKTIKEVEDSVEHQ